MHSHPVPSPWIVRFAAQLPPQGRVLDVACGSGRHATYLQGLGHHVTGVDRDAAAIEALQAGLPGRLNRFICADIENGPWPFAGEQFDAVVVTNYLWRPRLPQVLAAVAPGGWLLYETFAQGNEAYGKPSRPDFLLHPGELLEHCAAAAGWQVAAYEHGHLPSPDRVVQRIAAMRMQNGRP
ncbi:MAG: class I SAM-dependent methyltransferase [Comamonas sp.]